MPTLGLIAGAGGLPGAIARGAREDAWRVVAVGFEDITADALEQQVDAFERLPLGQVDALFSWLRDQGADDVVLAGKIDPARLSGGLSLDARGRAMLAGLADRRDDPLLSIVARELESDGFTVRPQARWLGPSLVRAEPLTATRPDARAQADAVLGWRCAEALGAAGVGQCVVVCNGRVVAVEAAEGTDETIRRAGSLGGAGATVVKRARPGQDLRFDLPASGPRTIAVMAEAGARYLVLEAERALLLDPERTLAAAEAAGIAVAGFASGGPPGPKLG